MRATLAGLVTVVKGVETISSAAYRERKEKVRPLTEQRAARWYRASPMSTLSRRRCRRFSLGGLLDGSLFGGFGFGRFLVGHREREKD